MRTDPLTRQIKALVFRELWDLRLDTAIREHLQRVMHLCNENRSEAALVLGIDRRQLQRLLARKGLSSAQARARRTNRANKPKKSKSKKR